MQELIDKINLDIEINKHCIDLDVSKQIKNILKLWIKYDEELLSLIRKVEINEYGSTKESK